MKRTTRWLVTLFMAALLAVASLGMSSAAARGFDDHQSIAAHMMLLDTANQDDTTGGEQQVGATDDVSELPSTGRGSVGTGSDTGEIVAEQIVQTILVLAAVVSIAFGGLALYARQKEL